MTWRLLLGLVLTCCTPSSPRKKGRPSGGTASFKAKDDEDDFFDANARVDGGGPNAVFSQSGRSDGHDGSHDPRRQRPRTDTVVP